MLKPSSETDYNAYHIADSSLRLPGSFILNSKVITELSTALRIEKLSVGCV